MGDVQDSYNRLNKDLETLNDWAHQWRVKFNESKTVYMHISLKQTRLCHPDLYLNNSKLMEVESHTHLGITLNNTMTWKDHVAKIVTKALTRVHMLKRIRFFIPRMTALTIYKSLIRPVVEYGDVLFDNMPLLLSPQVTS